MKKFIIVVCFLFAFLLGACTTQGAYAGQDNPLKIWFHNNNSVYQTLCVVDEDTGVNYVVVSTRWSTGNEPTSIAITPRLNADGSLYISK